MQRVTFRSASVLSKKMLETLMVNLNINIMPIKILLNGPQLLLALLRCFGYLRAYL